MRRFLALLLLVVTNVTGTQALPSVPACDVAEQVFGVDRIGDLIVQPFCVLPQTAYLPQRTLASFGVEVPRLFYGGQLSDNTVIFYGIGADGKLRWYHENGVTGRFGLGVVVGAHFGDWRGYQHLHSIDGELSGVDAQGRLWRWKHSGWRDGEDIWEQGGPEELGGVCPDTRPVFTGRNEPDLYVGAASNASYVYCAPNGQARIASLLPVEVFAMTMAAGQGVAYALRRADSRLVRLTLDVSSLTPIWRAGAVAGSTFSVIFTGRPICTDGPPQSKYEWQWNWYGRYS